MYKHILVVVCALTRFTMFIPVSNTTAEETLKVLSNRVFCVFGPPAVMVSDNGKAFRNSMADAMSEFWGYRNIYILPYNAQAKGKAESSVKRIKGLLDRHCKDYADWHKKLPVLQLMLNTTVHTGLGVSPYVALFGREPIHISQLENPALYPEPQEQGDGVDFIRELRRRLMDSQESLRRVSDDLRAAQIKEENSRK